MQRPALYFPYIHIRDESWLKAAALYWPHVSRIVPSEYAKHDSPTAAAFADAGILRDEDPGWLFESSAFEFFRAIEENADAVADLYGIDQAHAVDNPTGLVSRAAQGAPNLAWIHVQKFPRHLVDLLIDRGVAVRGRGESDHHRSGHWVGVHPALAGAYMTALANQISEKGAFDPLTDQTDLRIAMPNDDVRHALQLLVGESSYAEQATPGEGVETYVMLALQQVLPVDLEAVSADKIIAVRQSLAEELTNFREYVSGMQEELIALSRVHSERHRIERFTTHVEASIKQPLDQLERGLNKNGIETTVALLMTSAVAPPALVGGAFNLAGQSLSATGSVGVGVTALIGSAWWTARNRRRLQKQSTPVGYLLDVRNQLTPKGAFKKAAQFVGGV